MTHLYSNTGLRRTPRTCEQCGAPFLTYSWEVKKGKGRFCSTQCYGASHHRTVIQKFWDHVVVGVNEDDCWGWTGATDKDGYGKIADRGRNFRAHRVSFEIANGPLNPGMKACHTCDNPPCSNPAHLFAGTTLDNSQDRDAKGRQMRGERYPNHKLNEESVIAIRQACAAGDRMYADIANQFGIGKSLVSLIARGEKWAHVGGPITVKRHKRSHI